MSSFNNDPSFDGMKLLILCLFWNNGFFLPFSFNTKRPSQYLDFKVTVYITMVVAYFTAKIYS